MSKTKTIASVRVGKPDVSPSKPSHVPGVREGNTPRAMQRMDGIIDHGNYAVGSARRSTGINHEDREPIDPRMPNLSPS